MLEPTDLMLALCIVALAAALQSAVGFGLALVAAPFLLMIDARLIPGPLVLASLALTGLTAYRDRADIDLQGMGAALLGRAVGTVLAAVFLAFASTFFFDLAFGSLVMTAALLSGAGLHFTANRSSALIAGGASGLMGTISSIGGPPMAIIYQNSSTGTLRGTLAGYFAAGTAFTLIALWWVGRFGQDEVLLGLMLTPGTIVGFGLGHISRGLVPDKVIRPLIVGLSFLSGLFVLVRALI
ncbi:MAG: sulfite exporter TauE/SafE family protein [Myxococcota bacterium]|nr:sulfite exporter TauE/SafE family protein [Myxococcota bacterium]